MVGEWVLELWLIREMSRGERRVSARVGQWALVAVPLRLRRRFVVVEAALLGRNDQAELFILLDGVRVHGVFFRLAGLLLLLLDKRADVGQAGGGGGGCGGRMNSSADQVENVVESGIGRLLLREEMMRKRAVGRPQEWRRQISSRRAPVHSM